MKFDVIVKDISASELAALTAFLTGGTAALSPQISGGMTLIPPGTIPGEDTAGDVAVAAGTLDKDSLPHDARIHSETPTLTTKGIWRKKRGVSEALVAQVEAELRARTAGIPSQAQQPAAPANAQPMQPAPGYPQAAFPPQSVPNYPPPAQPMQPQYQQQPAPNYPPPAQQMPPQQPSYQQPASVPVYDFGSFMQTISRGLHTNRGDGTMMLDAPYLNHVTQRVAQQFGVPLSAITDLSHSQDQINFAVQIMLGEARWPQ